MFAQYWADLQRSLWNPESYAKLLFLLLTYPFWKPIVVAMWQELQLTLAPEGGLFARRDRKASRPRPPGLDPFVNVPLASHRRGGARGARAQRVSRRAPAAGSAFGRGRSPRRVGFRTAP